MENNVQPQSVDEFRSFLYSAQGIRKTISQKLLKNEPIENELIDRLRHAIEELTDNRTKGEMRSVTTKYSQFSIDIRDEINGLRKDIAFLEQLLSSGSNNYSDCLESVDFVKILGPYHPKKEEQFKVELEDCVRFLTGFASGSENGTKPMFITDWDGTMKDYCSQYATNIQPVYSAYLMGRFAREYTRATAVLTAGPLRGPGILDLTALPINGPVMFSGSWGREWFLKSKRVVHDVGIEDEGFDAISRLKDELNELFEGGEFSQFALVGSGVQLKVDRITLGVQTVFSHVPEDLKLRYIDAVKERIHRVDPYNRILFLEEAGSKFEIEICLKSSGEVWNKGNGVDALVETLRESLSNGRVLVAGDTFSDLPMLQTAIQHNQQNVFALFVGQDETLREKVRQMVDDDKRVCFVSCPDVVHAAFASLLTISKDID
ncbi:hypothetical protein WR25_23250 [Diploscapter pachys]|uniref:Uncharacterized protein n=1 Tax=Diploscapter pachys TaxID=2018661 RepID=A0A2A2JHV1_9BILA|nr:hypothetical protein WR25_23250 [Diploscapter pachys]